MSTFVFPSDEVLRVIILSGIIPQKILMSSAITWTVKKQDTIQRYIESSDVLNKELQNSLISYGIKISNTKCHKQTKHVSCWLEIFPTSLAKNKDNIQGLVLFEAGNESSLLSLAGELLRLGCDKQEIIQNETYLLKAVNPPVFTVLKAEDQLQNIKVFRPSHPGSNVFIQLGTHHPFLNMIQIQQEKLLLLSLKDHFRTLSNGPWTDLLSITNFLIPSTSTFSEFVKFTQPIDVILRLIKTGKSTPSSLWMIRENAIHQINRLANTLPDNLLSGLLFCVIKETNEKEPIIFLKIRPGFKSPELSIQGDSFSPHALISNVFIPCNRKLEPPITNRRLQSLLATEINEISVLVPEDNSEFRIEKISENAFAPLNEWVNYVVSGGSSTLNAWASNAIFDFESFVIETNEPPPLPVHIPPKQKIENIIKDTVEVNSIQISKKNSIKKKNSKIIITSNYPNEELEYNLTKLEMEFLTISGKADCNERQDHWFALAKAYSALNRRRDAGLCFTRALWDQDEFNAKLIAQTWAETELTYNKISTILEMKTPSNDDTRSVAAAIIADMDIDLNTAQRWLIQHDNNLDIRSLWLVHYTMSKNTGGDYLSLARINDRILQRLQYGLSIEQEVPTFLRFIGGVGKAPKARELAIRLNSIHEYYKTIQRKRSSIEASELFTNAYVSLIFAYGLACLGQVNESKDIINNITPILDNKDEVHGFLFRAYLERIKQACNLLPHETPLSPSLLGELNSIDRLSRYKIDRLREISNILESQKQQDPIRAFSQGLTDSRGEEFVELRGMTDISLLSLSIDNLFYKTLKHSNPIEKARIINGLMNFFPQLAVSQVSVLLTQILENTKDVDLIPRAELLEQALMLTGHFGLFSFIDIIINEFKNLIQKISNDQITNISELLFKIIRTLRRIGAQDKANCLLEILSKVTSQDLQGLISRLTLVSCFSLLGQYEQSSKIIEEGFIALDTNPQLKDKLQIIRVLSRALSYAPEKDAIHGLEQIFHYITNITDSFNTNSHFCLSVISFMESIVLGYSSNDLVLGDLGRRFLDEDEFLIRRRIHKDIQN